MPDVLIPSLSSALQPSTLEDVANHLAESPQAVSRGFELSIAAVLDRLIHNTGDSVAMRRVIDAASQTPPNALLFNFANGTQTPQNGSWLSGTQNLASSLFGENQPVVLRWLSRETGLRAASATAVLSLSVRAELERLGARVRQQGMTVSSLATYLQGERTSVHNALHPELQEILSTHRFSSPVIAQRIETNPVVGQGIKREPSFLPWVLAVFAGLLLFGWYFLRPDQPINTVVAPTPAVITPALVTGDLGSPVQRQLPGGSTLDFPERGVEGQLLAFIQDPARITDKTTWFAFDRLLFATGSATLEPQSQEQLRNIAAILKAYPNIHLKIGGYTDNVGNADADLKLSQDRAKNVTSEIIGMGISADRLVAEGYGEDHPVADNSTGAGRALNRRISMRVTQK